MNNYMVILLKELIILPNQEVKVELVSDISKNIIKKASIVDKNKVLVVAPINQEEINPDISDLPKIGVVARITKKLELSNGNLRVVLKGINRVVVHDYFYHKDNTILNAKTEKLILPKLNQREETAIKRKLRSSLKKYIKNNDVISNSVINIINSSDNLSKITDIITVFLPFDINKKLEYMQTINPITRGKMLIKDLEEEVHILKIEEEIEEDLKFKLIEKEKEFYLREKLLEIKKALGEDTTLEKEVRLYYEKLSNLGVHEKSYNKLITEIKRFEMTLKESPESAVIKNYLDTVLNLPWNKFNKECNNINKVKVQLNKTHYGLEDIKERIIDYVEINNIAKDLDNPIICLIGPPGVGKTTIASSIANSLNREFVKISVGGLNDSNELLGNRRTYLGAAPGKIMSGINKSNSKNPVILIDEVDKMVKDYKGDPASVLLDILDPSTNKSFVDNYIEEPFDLSKVLFILTANNIEDIPYPLLDRLEIYNLNSYTSLEKIEIARKYIIPKILKKYNSDIKIKLYKNHLETIINNYTKEAGVRELERVLDKLIRKVIINNFDKSINLSIIKEYLGDYIYDNLKYFKNDEIGISNYLAYTNYGGITSKIEVSKTKGTGKVIITGMVGKSLEESINVALSYIKSNYDLNFNNIDLHIHFLESTMKKDGPSAGISIISAILSLMLNKKVSNTIAFSGEVTLKGNVIKVGGIKEKLITAYNNNIETIYIPSSNKEDLKEIYETFKNLNIIFVDNYEDIFNDIFK